MSLYDLVLFVHVAAAVALLGGSVIASPAVRAAIRRARTIEEMRAYLSIGHPLLMLEPISALVILATGVYLTNISAYWNEGWVQVPAALWLVNAAFAGALVKPAIRRIADQAAAASDDLVGHELDTLRWSRRWSFGGDMLMANDAVALYLMSMKPALAESLLIVVAVNILVAATRAIRHGFRRGARASSMATAGNRSAAR
jgi:hypothetical protein